ncbi:MAG: Na+ dependent nucleoside transporter N-terminal domain-containing protein, partial [Desulfotignum sp.]|nr:Na+ dependent nucleoside transporter N-terminal domain-containing protein [Desulfotignum sp.]
MRLWNQALTTRRKYTIQKGEQPDVNRSKGAGHMMMLQGIAGLAVFVGLAWMASENRGQVKIKTIAMGLGLQILLALVL